MALGLAGARLRGWRCRRRIVVIESDDWGSIRMASREAYDRLRDLGWPVERSAYAADALETDEDLDGLFEVLGRFHDRRGRPACLTANMIVANPDFERVRASDFREYACEPVEATLARSPARQGVARRWREGLARRVFVPQLHAREHVRWWEWLDALRAGSQEARLTFDLGMCGVPAAASREGLSFYHPPYVDDATLARRGVDLDAMVRQGAALFRQQFGYTSLSAIAPNYCWTDRVERLWAAEGVRYIQGALFQTAGDPALLRIHHLGERGAAGGVYLLRSASLEHRERPDDAVGRCLGQVAWAFRFRKPAVIETHRMNYVGSILPESRRRGLELLARLLESILRRWPDAVFLSTPELGYLVEHGEDHLDALDDVAVPGQGSGHG